MNNTKLTQEGFKILETELNDLISVKRPKAVERLKKARGMGDLSENSDYSNGYFMYLLQSLCRNFIMEYFGFHRGFI